MERVFTIENKTWLWQRSRRAFWRRPRRCRRRPRRRPKSWRRRWRTPAPSASANSRRRRRRSLTARSGWRPPARRHGKWCRYVFPIDMADPIGIWFGSAQKQARWFLNTGLPKPDTVSQNQIGSGLVLHSMIWATCGKMQLSLKAGNWQQDGCILPEPGGWGRRGGGGYLNLFNIELSPKRYWQGPRSQEVGEVGDYRALRCHHQNDCA